jgi:hypothetical protein
LGAAAVITDAFTVVIIDWAGVATAARQHYPVVLTVDIQLSRAIGNTLEAAKLQLWVD